MRNSRAGGFRSRGAERTSVVVPNISQLTSSPSPSRMPFGRLSGRSDGLRLPGISRRHLAKGPVDRLYITASRFAEWPSGQLLQSMACRIEGVSGQTLCFMPHNKRGSLSEGPSKTLGRRYGAIRPSLEQFASVVVRRDRPTLPARWCEHLWRWNRPSQLKLASHCSCPI